MKSTVVYKKEPDFEIKGDFYSVHEKSGPVIIYIHGGGLLYGSREDIRKHQVELYNSAGYNVFSIDYRLAPETKIHDIIKDIDSALEWISKDGVKQFDINPNKVAVIGSSAGAYLALMSGTFKRKPQAIVSFYGYGDITGDWAIKPNRYYQTMTKVPKELVDMLISDTVISSGPIEKRYALYMYARQQGEWLKKLTGFNPNIKIGDLSEYCPLYSAKEDFPPSLLLHGTKDDDVPYEQSQLMERTLNEKKIVSKLITIPNGKHVFDEDWENPLVQNAYKEVITFLNTHLK